MWVLNHCHFQTRKWKHGGLSNLPSYIASKSIDSVGIPSTECASWEIRSDHSWMTHHIQRSPFFQTIFKLFRILSAQRKECSLNSSKESCHEDWLLIKMASHLQSSHLLNYFSFTFFQKPSQLPYLLYCFLKVNKLLWCLSSSKRLIWCLCHGGHIAL